MDQDYDGDEDGFSTDGTVKSASGPRCWARRGDKTSAPRRARSVARGPRRGRRDEASNALVRVPGHERKRPYNNLRRFLRVSGTNKLVLFLRTGSTKFRACIGVVVRLVHVFVTVLVVRE